MATAHATAFQYLVKDVTSWNIPPGPLPSELLLTGEAAFPVMVNFEGRVVIAASSYGKGRIVVMAHEGYLIHAPLAQFLVNAVRWLCLSPGATIGVNPSQVTLVKILQDSGVKAQIQSEPTESLGVYCLDAYNTSMNKKIIPFMKRGGGVLIGGQSWTWAEKNGNDKVLFGYPGNQVTGVAGVYFTEAGVYDGPWMVSETVPTIPLGVMYENNVRKDQEQLLQGITELDISRGAKPSKLFVHGPLAFPLGLDSSFNCFLAAARYGNGRVVLYDHESMVFEDRMGNFVINAIRWLKGQQNGKIGVSPQLNRLGPLLTKNNLEWSSTDLLSSDLSVYCCSLLNDTDLKKIEEFVAEGKGVLMGSQARQWAMQHPNSNFMSDYPNNKFLKHAGLCIVNEQGHRGCFPVPKPEIMKYHVRKALIQFESMVFSKGKVLEKSSMVMLRQDISYMLQISPNGISIYDAVYKNILKMIKKKGLPVVNKENPISRGSPQHLLLDWAYGLVKWGIFDPLLIVDTICLSTKEPSVRIDISPDNRDSWVSTGLYLPEGRMAKVTLPDRAVAAQLKVQVGCHTDDISEASTFKRPPIVTQEYNLNKTNNNISWLWGGLLYILVPPDYNLGTVQVTISGAVRAPYFKLGKTSQEEWKRSLEGNPAPWGELATDNIILTVPTENLKSVNNPESLLQLWDEIMKAAAKLASVPFPYRRPERIVTDVQICSGLLHPGYPIMGQLNVVPQLIDEKTIRSSGNWDVFHVLGHNQQRPQWQFPPHSTEADCNLWSVYLHEVVLNIPRARAHPNLKPESRKERIKTHMDRGAPLRKWGSWTALETYLQLQEGFGWEPFIQLFADYQTLSDYPEDNIGKMNLWMKMFSEIVQKNLVPFFDAWGWPIQKEVADSLASLPQWEENPMKTYADQSENCGIMQMLHEM
ncbi:TRPM8 channel-associated factor 3-like [Lepus europaeus]|uniref:TRPM8 channel-associated factor 3-like n=1 Tax=Lepus europaeus TaxID=9983 RepID=UPI002B4A5139|nr:TRPM8 channel-associated factor 3-like [Lepus europaeus]